MQTVTIAKDELDRLRSENKRYREIICKYLRGNGYPARMFKTVIKTQRLHGKYWGYTKVIRTVEDAEKFIIEDKNAGTTTTIS